MSKNWKTYKLGDLITVLTDYHANGAYKKLKANVTLLKEENFAVMIRTTNFEKNNFEDLIYVDEHAYEFLVKSKVYSGDILMNKIANAGSVYQMPKLDKPVTLAMNLFLLRFNDKVDQDYLFYHLKTNEPYIKSFSAGSVTKTITKDAVRNLEFKFPPLAEQTQIANILSVIDDKIENNLATNKILEDMATTLYKHWFVDFGPFQDGEFIESELGLIPKDWEVKPFLDMFDLLSGGTPKTSVNEYWNGQFNWVSAKDIGSSGSIYINDTEKKITQLGIDKSATKMLPEDAVIVVARGSVGKFGMITKPMCMNQSCYGIYSKSDYSQAITYLLIDSLMKHFLNVAYGSVFDTITTSTFKSINVLEPPKSVMNKVKEEIDVLFQKKKANIQEVENLTNLRDILLPKLISGEIRLKEFREELEIIL